MGYFAVYIKKKNKLTEEQEKAMSLNIAKYTLFYWLCDLFFMSFIIDSTACKYIIGGLIMLIIFYNLSTAIINQTNKIGNGFIKFGIIQDFLVGVGISVYLIYIIADTILQGIVVAIVAAIYGGLFTLVGVAWTIRKGDADRKAELLRIENERKEEERKLHVPYLKAVVGIQPFTAVKCNIKQPLNFDDEKSMAQMEKDTFYRIMIDNFIVKNVSSHNILLRGIILDDEFYKFENQQLLEANTVCQVQTTRNWELAFAKPLQQFLICVEDIIGNQYTISCKLNPNMKDLPIIVTTDNGKEYHGWCYKYVIDNLALPILVGDKK